MGTSLAILALAVSTGVAQPPNPVPPSNQVPNPLPPAYSPLPQLVPADAPPPSRVVIFQKPAGDNQPAPNPGRPVSNGSGLPPGTGQPAPVAPVPQPETNQPPMPTVTDPKKSTYAQPGGRARYEIARLENDTDLQNRLTQELYNEAVERIRKSADPNQKPAPIRVPPVEALIPPGTPYVTKVQRYNYPAMQTLLEPEYIVHRRLYFEEKNSERYGWDMGILQPVISTASFYKDVVLFPAHFATNARERYDSNAGKCLPGSPVPYYLYPPQISLFGAGFAAGTFVGLAAVIP